MKTFLFSYSYQGAESVFEIRAESAEDAKKRVMRLQYATLDGELVAKVPTNRVFVPLLSHLLSALTKIFSLKRS